MSKILKTIVNLVVLFSIVIAAALLVPPFAGVDTVMNDNGSTDTNLPVGSVAYGKDVRVKDLKKKDKIIFSEGSSTYVYEITDMDSSAGAYEVKDPYSKSGDTEVITLQKSVPKVAVVVPFIGYAAIALQTKGGLIVIGLGIILLIILFILSELWSKDEDEEEEESEDEDEEDDDEEDEEEETLSRRERRRLRKEEKLRRKEEKRRLKEEEEDEEYEEDDDEEDEEEETLSRKERRRLKKEEKRRRKLEKKGLLEEEDEDEDEAEEPEEEKTEELQGFDEAMKDAMSSIALGVSAVNQEPESAEEVPVQPQPETLTEEAEVNQQPEVVEKAEEVQPEITDTVEIPEELPLEEEIPVNVNAVPKTPTVQELLAKAKQAGEEPEVKKDKENEVTLLDYSDLL